ncbi:hypothetical protein [Kitasatospora sp. NBC_01302]|uniref:hypothetical protein n=1 Tax=Kitasatospora sp. NBC_01302 TaxID=2903575 RepID=UPI002E0F1C1F|nr:hypothetical protein OG294_27800 [Kitasatospora sp. NBC_01302]
MPDTQSVTKTVLATHYTAAGSAVEVVQYDITRAANLEEAAAQSGPYWRCHGCHDRSDRPLNNPAIGDPVGVVTGAAIGHAGICRY